MRLAFRCCLRPEKAILELESEIGSLKLQLLRSPHPDQLMLPGMEDLPDAKEGKQEASHRDDVAS